MATNNRISRRDVLAGFSLLGLPATALAQNASALPTLRSGRNQFVEFAPVMPVPNFQLTRLDGKKQSLHEFRGRVLIVNFWASWCPPCRTELPILERLNEKAGSTGPRAIAISIDAAGAKAASPFVSSLGIRHLPVFLDPAFKVARRADEAGRDDPFRLFGLPMSYVLSPDMHNLGYFTGLVDWTSPDAEKLLTAAGSRARGSPSPRA